MSKRQHLNNNVDLLAADTWSEFLAKNRHTVKMEEHKGWTWYRNVNCHYFVSPRGFVYSGVYGYHGWSWWKDMVESGAIKKLQEIRKFKNEMRTILAKFN